MQLSFGLGGGEGYLSESALATNLNFSGEKPQNVILQKGNGNYWQLLISFAAYRFFFFQLKFSVVLCSLTVMNTCDTAIHSENNVISLCARKVILRIFS